MHTKNKKTIFAMMITASELRTGNLLYYNINEIGYDWEKTTIDWQDIKWCEEKQDEFNEVHKPIPLTIEWWAKFEYQKIPTEYNQGGIEHQCGKFFLRDCDDGSMGVEIKYVHQLQNLYFALTQKELKLKT